MQVYVINLPRSVKRRDYMRKQLAAFGIEPKWIAGGDREDMTRMPPNYSSQKANRDIMRDMGLGEIGCLMGHLRAFQEIIDSGDEWGIILEDDVDLRRNPVEAFTPVAALGGKLILGSDDHYKPRRRIRRTLDDGVHELSAVPYGAFCYAIHRKFAAQAIVHLAQSLHMPGDVYFRHACRKDPHGFYQVEIAREAKIGGLSCVGDEARMANKPRNLWRAIEVSNVCPKLIHQIWLGPRPTPEHIETWRRVNPGRIHKLWTASELWNILADYDLQDAFTSYISSQMYPAAADIARYCILHRFGGFYADADSEALRWLDIATPFLVYESEKFRPGLICNGFLQVRQESPLMEEVIDRVRSLEHPVEPATVWKQLGPGLLTDVAKNHQIDVLTSSLFLPYHFEGENIKPGISPYCKHDWDSTHVQVSVPKRRFAPWLSH